MGANQNARKLLSTDLVNANNYYNIAAKDTQFQSSNLLASSACFIISWMHTGDVKNMKLLKSVSF